MFSTDTGCNLKILLRNCFKKKLLTFNFKIVIFCFLLSITLQLPGQLGCRNLNASDKVWTRSSDQSVSNAWMM